MTEKCFMGIDIGTSGIRAALFDLDGRQLSLAYREYPMICTEQGMAELDPEVVFSSLIQVVRTCTEESKASSVQIEAIGLSTQMHSFLAVDGQGKCLTNVLTWADTRPMAQAKSIENNFDTGILYNKTGCRAQHPMYPLSKVLWLKEVKPDVFAKANKFTSIKGYILYRLFGRHVIDITDASTTAYFNIHKFTWDQEILKDILGATSEKFPEPVECTFTLKGLKQEYAQEMGLPAGIPVVVGSGDGIMANVGCGVFDDTRMSSTIGTSGALRIAVGKPLLDAQQRTWCYCFTKDTWVAGGAINNGGIVLKWLRDEFRKLYEQEAEAGGYKNIYKLFDAYASEIKPGSDGLLFLPYLTGERAPGWNAGAKGTLHGLQLIHGRKHFIRAAMEGVIFKMFSIFDVITQLNSNVRTILANGGYVSSDIWLQIQADVFDKKIAVAGIAEAAVFGAAYTAMAATGYIGSLRQELPAMQPLKVIKPSGEYRDLYRNAYLQYRELYRKIYE